MGQPPNGVAGQTGEWRDELARAVHRLTLSVEQYRARAGRDRYGVDPSGVAALAVLHLRGPLTPRQIAGAIDLSPPATTELLDRLDQAGYIVRAPHPTDRRKVLIIPTPSADELAERDWADFAAMLGERADQLDPASRARLIGLLGEFGRALEQANEQSDARPAGSADPVRRAR